MYSKPDFYHKQILFINTLEAGKSGLKFSNDNIVFTKDDKIISKMSCHKLWAIFIIGDLTITTKVIEKATRLGVSFHFLSRRFNDIFSINSQASGNYFLRQQQYTLSPAKELELAKNIVANKINNQLQLVYNKFVPTKTTIHKTRHKANLTNIQVQIAACKDSQQLLAIEGRAAKDYFAIVFKELEWRRRCPQTKEDITNLLLDIGYTYLFNLIDSLLEVHGFDTYKGVYHKLYFQRKSLACDLMEPFRPLIDWTLLKAFRLGQIDTKDFKFAKGSYYLDYKVAGKYSNIFLQMLLDKKMDLFEYIRDYYYYTIGNDEATFPTYKFNIR